MPTTLSLLTAAEMSDHTGIPESTLRRWLAEGRICAHGTRSRRLYDLAEVDQVMALLGRCYRPPRVALDEGDR